MRLGWAQQSTRACRAACSPQINKFPKSAWSPRATGLVVKPMINAFPFAQRCRTELRVTVRPSPPSLLSKLGGVSVCCKPRNTPRGLKSEQARKAVASLAQTRHLRNTCTISAQTQRLTLHGVRGLSCPGLSLLDHSASQRIWPK